MNHWKREALLERPSISILSHWGSVQSELGHSAVSFSLLKNVYQENHKCCLTLERPSYDALSVSWSLSKPSAENDCSSWLSIYCVLIGTDLLFCMGCNMGKASASFFPDASIMVTRNARTRNRSGFLFWRLSWCLHLHEHADLSSFAT